MTQCKYILQGFEHTRCIFDVVKDGYCGRHHPGMIADRKTASDVNRAEQNEAIAKYHTLAALANDPDNCIVKRADLQGLLTLLEWNIPANALLPRDKNLVTRMETKLKESL